MIRKKSALVFLFIAAILFVAHAIVPHHHHQEVVCFVDNHCESTDDHQHDHSDHEHDGPVQETNCTLSNVISLPADLSKDETEVKQVYLLTDFVLIFASVIKENEIDFNYHHNYPNFLYPYHYYTDVILASNGLRAPPIISI